MQLRREEQVRGSISMNEEAKKRRGDEEGDWKRNRGKMGEKTSRKEAVE